MEIQSMTEAQKEQITDAAALVESFASLVDLYAPCRQSEYIIKKLEEAMMWFNQLTMIGDLKFETSSGETKQ